MLSTGIHFLIDLTCRLCVLLYLLFLYDLVNQVFIGKVNTSFVGLYTLFLILPNRWVFMTILVLALVLFLAPGRLKRSCLIS